MGSIEFLRPICLLLLIPSGWLTWYLAQQSLAGLSPSRARLGLVLRGVIVLMLVLALAGTRMVRRVSRECVIFVVDVSDSISKSRQKDAISYVNSAVQKLRGDQKAGLVVFGGDASVETAPSELKKLDRIYSIPDTHQTNISQAIGLGLALFPEECAKKIVLLSDGNETMGKCSEQAMLAGSEDVSIDVVPISSEVAHEALLDKIICPGTAKIGEPFDLKVIAVSKEPATGVVRILRNGVQTDQRAVQLVKGKSILTFQQSVAKAGSYEYKAILDCKQDTLTENNVALGYTMVKGKPKVLYVEGSVGQEKYLASALRSSDIEVELRGRSGIPTSPADLHGFDAVVLSDIPASCMTMDQMSLLRSGVYDMGIGLTMIGGEQGFGAGGYLGTPIEDALPVEMSVRKKKVMPSLSVVVAIDKSGSMGMEMGGVPKIQLAADAAASVVKMLQPIDYVGVIICHDHPVTVVPMQQADKKEDAYSEISTIQAGGGGIFCYPTMELANEIISPTPSRVKHVVLIADGDDSKGQEGTIDLVRKMAARRITVSTVAVGSGHDIEFLKAVAAVGHGGFFIAKGATDLRALVLKDVMSVSKSLIVEEPFIPVADPASPELSGIRTDQIPPLLGYVTTSGKPSARVSLISHKKDPILATWQYGLGRSAAFTSDCKARWSARWVAWPEYGKFWSQVIRSTMRKNPSSDFQTVVDVEGGTGSVTIDAVDDKGEFINQLKFAATVVTPDYKSHSLAIDQTGPGRYEGGFEASKIGNYLVSVSRKDQSAVAPDVNVVSIPYPPEYKSIDTNLDLLRDLAARSGGQFSPRADEVFGRNFRGASAHVDIWRFIVLISALLLPIDIAVRRLTMSLKQAEEVLERVKSFVKAQKQLQKAPKAREHAENVSVLLKAKRERKTAFLEDIHDRVQERESARTVRSTPDHSGKAERPGSQSQIDEGSYTSKLLEAKRRAREDKD